jgi:hypothetical protein
VCAVLAWTAREPGLEKLTLRGHDPARRSIEVREGRLRVQGGIHRRALLDLEQPHGRKKIAGGNAAVRL